MKRKIFMYLFLFSALLVIFQYVNSKRILENYEHKIDTSQRAIEAYKDSIMRLEDENLELLYFNLENNDDALSYFEDNGYDTSELIPFIKDELRKLNVYEGDDR